MQLKRLIPLTGLLIFIIVLSQVDLTAIYTLFRGINPLYAILSFFIFIPLLLVVTVEWQLLLRGQKIHVSSWYAIKNFFIGYFYGFITPGGVGGYSRAVYLADESGEPIPKCFSNIVIFNTIELLAMFIPGFIGAIALSSVYPFLSVFIIGFVILILLLYFIFYKSKHSRSLFTKIISSKVFDGLHDRFDVSVESFYDDVPRLQMVIIPFIISIAGWIMKYVLLFFVAHLFNIYIPFISFILILAVSDVIASLPISIYGLGTREAALITMCSFPKVTGGVIVAPEQIVSLSLFWFVIIWVVPSLIGFFVTYHETKRFYQFDLTEKNCLRFERYMRKYTDLYHDLAGKVKNQIVSSVKNPLIVDLGSGPGIFTEAIQNQLPDAKIIDIDPSEEMLGISKKQNPYALVAGTSGAIPLNANSVDVVVSRFNLTYWDDPLKGFNDIYRILKPGGSLVLEGLNKEYSRVKLFLTKLDMIRKQSGLSIAQYHVDAYKTAYTIPQVNRFAQQAQFKKITVDGGPKDWKFIITCKK